MYDFYKLFQEDKCIEKVKQVLHFLMGGVGGRDLKWAWLDADLLPVQPRSFWMRSPPTSAKSPACWRTQWS